MDKKKIYHAAVYVRLSKEDDDIAVSGKVESDSISNQKSLIHNFINGHDDIVLTKEYVDDGYSGANFDRPQFQMMLADIKQGIIDCVIVKDLSRFGREYIDSGMYIERLFPSLGVRFIAINDHVDSLDDDRNDIILPFKNLMNDAYCRDISIKIRSHLDVKRRNGEYVSSFVTYGYMKSETDKHVIVPDPYAADVVRMIFRMKLNGKSHERIADYLNNEGILSPAEYKHSRGIHIQDHFKTHEQAMWSAMAVRRILGNDIYIGVLTQGIRSTPNNKVKQSFIKEKKDWVRIEDNHEAIIDKHSFSVVQKLLDQDLRTAHEEENVYPLAGVMVCADCGSVMVRQDIPAGGKMYSYYVCSRHKNEKNCSPHRISKHGIESMVLELLQTHIANVIDIEEICRNMDATPFQEIEIRELEKRKEDTEKDIHKYCVFREHLYEDMKDGLITREDYLEMYESYGKKRDRAEKILARISEEIEHLMENRSDRQEWFSYFKKYGNIEELSRVVVVELIDRIRVIDKKHVEVVFNYEDNYKLLLKQLGMMGYDVSSENGRLFIEKVEVG